MPGATFGETIVDAITLLKQDHKAVKALFAEFDKAAKAKDPARSEIVAKIIAELSRKRLAELGELLENAKKTAPRVPHPLVVVRR